MELIREVRKVFSNDITMHVFEDFLNKEIEITKKNGNYRIKRKKGKIII